MCYKMADSEKPGCSSKQKESENPRKKRRLNTEDVLKMLSDASSADSDNDSYMSDDSLQNELENTADSRKILNESEILQFANSEDEDRIDRDCANDTGSDPDFSLDSVDSQISDSDSDCSNSSDTDNYTPPTCVERGRGKARAANVRQRGRGRGRGSRSSVRGRTRGRGRGRGVRDFDNSTLETPSDTYQPDIPPFIGMPGIEMDALNSMVDEKPIDFYKLFLTDDFVDHLVTETNKYADQTINSAKAKGPMKKYSRMKLWEEVDSETMRQFIGLQLLTGLIDKPSYESYFSTSPILYTPIFNYVMTRNRFQEILRFWHANDNSNEPPRGAPNRDRLFKLRPVIEHLQNKFENVYTPEKEVAIDESLLLWKGQLVFKQYIPLKRARFGIKLFNLCEQSGYTYRFHIYAGKEDPAFQLEQYIPNDATHLTMTEKVVVFMMQPLLDKGYQLYMDNWYSGYHLYSYMLSRGTVCCGTIRENRCPLPVKNLKLEAGVTMKALRSGPVLFIKWQSSKVVYMISTMHDNSVKLVRKRGCVEQVPKPSAVVSYNTNMGAVDRCDQILHTYDATRKTTRWYKKLLLHLLQVALLNSYIVYSKHPGAVKMDFYRFQVSVIHDLLITDTALRNPTVDDLQHGDLVRLKERHFPEKVPQTDKLHQSSRRCLVCKAHGIRKDSTYMCGYCPQKPALCVIPCFQKYHTLKKY